MNVCLILQVIKSTSGQKILKAFDMDPEAFLDLANQVAKVKMYPYFDLAHAVVCCLIIKEDMGSGKSKIKVLEKKWVQSLHSNSL